MISPILSGFRRSYLLTLWLLGWSFSALFSHKEMALHSNILAWKVSWTQEPGGLQSIGSQTIRHNWATNTLCFKLPVIEHTSALKWREKKESNSLNFPQNLWTTGTSFLSSFCQKAGFYLMVLVPEWPLLPSLLCRCSFLTGACIRLGLCGFLKKKKTLEFLMQIKTTVRCHFTLLGMLLLKSQEITSVGEKVERQEPSYIVVRM